MSGEKRVEPLEIGAIVGCINELFEFSDTAKISRVEFNTAVIKWFHDNYMINISASRVGREVYPIANQFGALGMKRLHGYPTYYGCCFKTPKN